MIIFCCDHITKFAHRKAKFLYNYRSQDCKHYPKLANSEKK